MREVHEHALRARGHDRRPRHPVRDEPRRLHLPPARGASTWPTTSAREMGMLTVGERLQPTLPGVEEATTRRRAGRRRCSRPRTGPRPRRCAAPRRRRRCARGARTRPRAETVLCHVCGDIMQRAGTLPRLPELRRHQRLFLNDRSTCSSCGSSTSRICSRCPGTRCSGSTPGSTPGSTSSCRRSMPGPCGCRASSSGSRPGRSATTPATASGTRCAPTAISGSSTPGTRSQCSGVTGCGR